MAFEDIVWNTSMRVSANAASGIGQFCAVKLDVAGGSDVHDCIPATANTDAVIGINQDMGSATTTLGASAPNATAGESISVCVLGKCKAQVASAVSRGDLLVVANSTGQLATAPALTGTTATSVHIVGIAMQAGTAAGDVITVLLTPMASSIVQA